MNSAGLVSCSFSLRKVFWFLPLGFFHALRLRGKLANSCCLAACMSRAAVMSVCARAWRSRSSMVTSSLRCTAQPGSWRRISRGVAYQQYLRLIWPLASAANSGTPHGRWLECFGCANTNKRIADRSLLAG